MSAIDIVTTVPVSELWRDFLPGLANGDGYGLSMRSFIAPDRRLELMLPDTTEASTQFEDDVSALWDMSGRIIRLRIQNLEELAEEDSLSLVTDLPHTQLAVFGVTSSQEPGVLLERATGEIQIPRIKSVMEDNGFISISTILAHGLAIDPRTDTESYGFDGRTPVEFTAKINIADAPEGLPFEPEEARFFVRVLGEFDDGSTNAVDIESPLLPGTLSGRAFEFNGTSDITDSNGVRQQRQGSINGTYGADFQTIESAVWQDANQVTFNGSPVRSGSSTVRIRNLPEDVRLDFRASYVVRGESACDHIEELRFTDTDGGDTRTLVDFSCDLSDPFVSISIEGEPK